jgi:hypothetical protein
MIMHTPISADIQPSQPFITSQPGPGEDSPSIRDIKFGFDLIDTLSGMSICGQEKGQFKLDRVDLRSFILIDD